MITITPYKSTWPDEFAAIAGSLVQALGDLAVRVDHIGSTAIVGLAAKDRIDIQITALSLDPAIEEALSHAGYLRLKHITQDHVPPGYTDDAAQWSKWMFKPADPAYAVNVHVRLQGHANQRYALLFRDYLRAHPAIAAAYGQVKQQLAAHNPEDEDIYYDIKDPVCDIIIGAAEAWAATTGRSTDRPVDC